MRKVFVIGLALSFGLIVSSCGSDSENAPENCKPVKMTTDYEGSESVATFKWDGDKLVSAEYDNGEVEFEYDDKGRLMKNENSMAGATTYQYRDDGELQAVLFDGQEQLSCEYQAGYLTHVTYPSGGYEELEYDDNDRVVYQSSVAPDGSASTYTEYDYDSRGNRTYIAVHQVSYETGEPYLSSVTETTFNDKPNVIALMTPEVDPLFYDNPNNALKITETTYNEAGETMDVSVTENTYEYNDEGLMVKKTSYDAYQETTTVQTITYDCE